MVPGDVANDHARRESPRLLLGVAHKILFSRAAFRQVLPDHVTHDPGLEALLTLFVQEEQCMGVLEFDRAMSAIGASLRWKKALEHLALVAAGPEYVALTEHGRRTVIDGLRLVLDAQMRTA